MKLAHPQINTIINFKENPIWFLVVENKKQYYSYAFQLYNQSLGAGGDFCISLQNNVLDFAKNVLYMHDFINVDFSSKKVKNAIETAVLEEIKNSDYLLELANITTSLTMLNDKILSQIDLPIEFSEEFTVEKFVKISEYSILSEQTLLDKIITYVDVFLKLKKIKIVIFVGLLSFLTNQELEELITQLKYMEIKVIFLDGIDLNVKYPKIIIDNDLCEI